MRLRAVWCALWFGLRPWWLYEETPHYECSYREHLVLNLRLALVWILHLETAAERAFERRVNPTWRRTPVR